MSMQQTLHPSINIHIYTVWKTLRYCIDYYSTVDVETGGDNGNKCREIHYVKRNG